MNETPSCIETSFFHSKSLNGVGWHVQTLWAWSAGLCTIERPRPSQSLLGWQTTISHSRVQIRSADGVGAGHAPRPCTDRVWLHGKCIDWDAKLERSRYELRSGKQSVDQVLKAADTTIENLVAALRKKAAEIEARPDQGSAVG